MLRLRRGGFRPSLIGSGALGLWQPMEEGCGLEQACCWQEERERKGLQPPPLRAPLVTVASHWVPPLKGPTPPNSANPRTKALSRGLRGHCCLRSVS